MKYNEQVVEKLARAMYRRDMHYDQWAAEQLSVHVRYFGSAESVLDLLTEAGLEVNFAKEENEEAPKQKYTTKKLEAEPATGKRRTTKPEGDANSVVEFGEKEED